jgi:hypothetical protein
MKTERISRPANEPKVGDVIEFTLRGFTYKTLVIYNSQVSTFFLLDLDDCHTLVQKDTIKELLEYMERLEYTYEICKDPVIKY